MLLLYSKFFVKYLEKNMKTTPVKGTNDYMPKEAELRDYLQGEILRTYTSQGFRRIYTPILEDISNLEHSDGGDNLSLIFKVLKRGEKLASAIEKGDDLADMGLRYDLTLPLSRFYAEHNANLPIPFKVIQMDRVYRAERPQKGRSREFVQCDIDILGSNSINCEIELIHTTASALLNIGIKNFCIEINNRALLKKVLAFCGFDEKDFDSVCITFDKLDKIGADGVISELVSKGYNENAIKSFEKIVRKPPSTLAEVKLLTGECEEVSSIEKITTAIECLSKGKYEIKFNLSLVRGQGYYTGCVFEIKSADYHCSIGGGGRYDGLVGKFIGKDVPAVGFSIGFERIYSILAEKNVKIPHKPRLAVIYEDDNFVESMAFAEKQKESYDISLFACPKKLGKLLSCLEEDGFCAYVVIREGKEIKKLGKK